MNAHFKTKSKGWRPESRAARRMNQPRSGGKWSADPQSHRAPPTRAGHHPARRRAPSAGKTA